MQWGEVELRGPRCNKKSQRSKFINMIMATILEATFFFFFFVNGGPPQAQRPRNSSLGCTVSCYAPAAKVILKHFKYSIETNEAKPGLNQINQN